MSFRASSNSGYANRLEVPIVDLARLLQPTGGDGIWTGMPGPAVGPRLFGGQAVAQALLAAAGEEDGGRLPCSLHAHFLKAGHVDEPVEYRVTTLTAGRSFATRRVDAFQGEALIFAMTASFHIPEPGFSHSSEAPFPLDLEAAQARLKEWRETELPADPNPILRRLQDRPIEIVPLHPSAVFGTGMAIAATGSWMRARECSTDDPAMQRALLSYASDMMFLRNALLPHNVRPGGHGVQAASLDHAIWFHETPDFSQWHLYATESPWAGHARGLNRGQFFREDGTLVATVQQESLMRPMGEARAGMDG